MSEHKRITFHSGFEEDSYYYMNVRIKSSGSFIEGDFRNFKGYIRKRYKECGNLIGRSNPLNLCGSCIQKGEKGYWCDKKMSESSNDKKRKIMTGNTNCLGCTHSKESAAKQGAKKENHWNWKGGFHIRRNLVFHDILIIPMKVIEEDWNKKCVKHHITDNFCVPTPEDIHVALSNPDREQHRALVEEWWRQVDYDVFFQIQLAKIGHFNDLKATRT